MSTLPDALPWSSIQLSEPEIPWADLHAFAAAAAGSSEVRSRLMTEVNQLLDRRHAGDEASFPNLADLAVPAIFALAAERFNDEGRREVAEFLIHLLYRAGEADDDFLLEVIEQAAGRLGPALIEPAKKLIETKGYDLECWFHLFSLLEVVRDVDGPTKEGVVRLCRRVIREAPDRFEPFSSIEPAAWVLASLGDAGSLPLIRSIYEVSQSGDLEEVIKELEGKGSPFERDRLRSRTKPVEIWLPERVEQVRSWLESREADDEDAVDEEDEPESAYDRYGDLLDDFMVSQTCEALPETVREDAGFAVSTFLIYMWEYLGTPLEELTPLDVNKILLDYFPRKITSEKEFFEHAPRILTTFLKWLGEKGKLADPGPLCAEVNSTAKDMLRRSQDPGNWGMAKSFHMKAEAEGVDTTDPTAMGRYTLLYNLRNLFTAARRPQRDPQYAPDDPDNDEYITQPVVRESARVGRNDPCPCGSGKKYKKCCGR